MLEHQIGANLLQQLSEPPPQPAPPPIWLAPLPQSVLHHICQAQYEWQLAQAQAQQHVMLQLAAQLGAPAAPPPTLLSARQAPHAAPAMEQVLGGAERLLVGVEAPYPSYCNQVGSLARARARARARPPALPPTHPLPALCACRSSPGSSTPWHCECCHSPARCSSQRRRGQSAGGWFARSRR